MIFTQRSASLMMVAAVLVAPMARAADTPPPPAPAPPPPSTLEEKIEANARRLDAQAKELEQLRAALAEETTQRHKAEDSARAARVTGAAFRIGGLDVKLGGFIQADVVAYNSSSKDEVSAAGEPLNETRFTLRRARLNLSADYHWLAGFLEFDGNTVKGFAARVFRAEVTLQWLPPTVPRPYIAVSIGLLRIPFGYDVQLSDASRIFLERSSVSRGMFPGEFDLGARLQGGWKFLRYQVAAMNGNPSSDRQFAARDPNRSKDLVARLGVDTPIGKRFSLMVGGSMDYGTGFHANTFATANSVVWNDLNSNAVIDQGELTGVVGKMATPAKNFRRWAAGADARLGATLPTVGEGVLYAEVIVGQNLDRNSFGSDPVASGRTLNQLGWYVAYTQELTKWAIVAVRYDRYNPDRNAPDTQVPRDQTQSTWALVLAGAYPPYGRLILEYDHNKNKQGKDAAGMPTTLNGEVVTLRGQLVY